MCITGVEWQVGKFETSQGDEHVSYRLGVGLKQANISMAKYELESDRYKRLEYHNVKIGWEEGKNCCSLMY